MKNLILVLATIFLLVSCNDQKAQKNILSDANPIIKNQVEALAIARYIAEKRKIAIIKSNGSYFEVYYKEYCDTRKVNLYKIRKNKDINDKFIAYRINMYEKSSNNKEKLHCSLILPIYEWAHQGSYDNKLNKFTYDYRLENPVVESAEHINYVFLKLALKKHNLKAIDYKGVSDCYGKDYILAVKFDKPLPDHFRFVYLDKDDKEQETTAYIPNQLYNSYHLLGLISPVLRAKVDCSKTQYLRNEAELLFLRKWLNDARIKGDALLEKDKNQNP